MSYSIALTVYKSGKDSNMSFEIIALLPFDLHDLWKRKHGDWWDYCLSLSVWHHCSAWPQGSVPHPGTSNRCVPLSQWTNFICSRSKYSSCWKRERLRGLCAARIHQSTSVKQYITAVFHVCTCWPLQLQWQINRCLIWTRNFFLSSV